MGVEIGSSKDTIPSRVSRYNGHYAVQVVLVLFSFVRLVLKLSP